MDTKNFIEISGVVLAVALAIFGILRAKENWKDNASIINVSLSLVLITLLISIRYQIIPRIEENQYLAGLINEHPDAFHIAESYIEAQTNVENTNNILFNESLKELKKQFIESLELAKNGQFIISQNDLGAFSIKLIEGTNQFIIATSYVKDKEFWNNSSGRQYEELNFKLAKNGKHITRYFIFSNYEEYKNGLSRMNEQSKKGIQVYTAFTDQLNRLETDDVIIVDNKICGRLKLTPDKGISHAIMYTKQSDLESIYKVIDNLKAKSKKFLITN